MRNEPVFRLLSILLGVVSVSVIASPTPNEFVPCNKLAVAMLESCLADSDKKCWEKSKNSYESCRKKIFKRHDKDKAILERQETEKRAKEKRLNLDEANRDENKGV